MAMNFGAGEKQDLYMVRERATRTRTRRINFISLFFVLVNIVLSGALLLLVIIH